MPDFKRAPATPPLRVPPPPTWAAMQRLLAEGQGWVRSREVYRVERWHGAASTKRFDGRVVTDPAFTALCTECGKTFATHGWTGTEYVCPGDWLLQDRSGALRRFKPAAFLDQHVAESRQSPAPREL